MTRTDGGGLPVEVILVLALGLAVAFAGCASDEPASEGDNTTDDAAGDDPQADRESGCQERAGSSQRSSGVQMVCQDVDGADTQSKAFDCPNPDQSALGVATNMTAGSVTVTVLDAGDAPVFEQTYDTPGPQNDSARINQGQAGNWTAQAERSADFSGSYGVQVACATS